ncbi:MAG: hypoxanthine phosphoribosyltransferase [Clostridia bacterium]|nr:hypoxanthine phosphoribosyltransferase [Clostridia bacterium]
MSNLDNVVERVAISREELSDKVKELGKKITEDYQGKDLVLICVLRGAIVFFSDLLRQIDLPVTIDTLAASSYGNSSVSSGKVIIEKDISVDIQGKHVLIIEDIIDSGYTMNSVVDMLKSRSPASVKICALLDKPSRRQVDIKGDYVAYTVGDEFVAGYGLDYAQLYRNLPDICVLKESVYR